MTPVETGMAFCMTGVPITPLMPLAQLILSPLVSTTLVRLWENTMTPVGTGMAFCMTGIPIPLLMSLSLAPLVLTLVILTTLARLWDYTMTPVGTGMVFLPHQFMARNLIDAVDIVWEYVYFTNAYKKPKVN